MFKSKSHIAAITLLLSLGTAGANAAEKIVVLRPVVVTAAHVPHRHVPPGVTAGEAARIRYQIHEHHQMQRTAGSDGTITRREQAWLARDAAQVRHLVQKAKTH